MRQLKNLLIDSSKLQNPLGNSSAEELRSAKMQWLPAGN
jgi:hypothetical protein